jgi:hypothetical protein
VEPDTIADAIRSPPVADLVLDERGVLCPLQGVRGLRLLAAVAGG